MEERITQRPREAQAATVAAEPAPPPGTPCDDDAPLAPAVQLLLPSSSGEELEFDFEFPFVSRDSPAGTAAPADELFADGRIRTFYPVFFGRGGAAGCSSSSSTALPAAPPPRVRGQLGKLFLEETQTRERDSSASSTSSSSATATDDDGLEGAAPESYCVWRPAGSSPSPSPSPAPPPRKSGSTGSVARWRRISDLVVGRSHSDGREKFLFLAAAPPAHKKPAAAAAGARNRKPPPPHVAGPATDAAAHRIAYLASRAGGVPVPPPAGGTPRRTFLPYREELVGFFAGVNGIRRSHHHPF